MDHISELKPQIGIISGFNSIKVIQMASATPFCKEKKMSLFCKDDKTDTHFRLHIISKSFHILYPEKSMKVLAAQSSPSLCNPMDCSPPDSFVHGILQARILGWVAIPLFQEIFPAQGSNLSLPHCRQILYRLSHQGSPTIS